MNVMVNHKYQTRIACMKVNCENRLFINSQREGQQIERENPGGQQINEKRSGKWPKIVFISFLKNLNLLVWYFELGHNKVI